MRYRDLVFVLCLVAVAAVWWTYPTGPDSSEGTELAVVESLSPSPVATALVEEPPLKMSGSELEMPKVPKLELVLRSRGAKVEDIVLRATLTTEVDALIPMLDGRPCATIRTESVGHSMEWLPRSEEAPKNKELKKGETLTWDLEMKSLRPWEEVQELTEWSNTEPLLVRATVVEGGSIEPSPFMRSMHVTMHGEVTITPHKE